MSARVYRFGEAGLKGGMGGFGGGAEGFSNPFDIFEQFFGGGMGGGMGNPFGREPMQQAGSDGRFDLVLDFEEAVFGCR